MSFSSSSALISSRKKRDIFSFSAFFSGETGCLQEKLFSLLRCSETVVKSAFGRLSGSPQFLKSNRFRALQKNCLKSSAYPFRATVVTVFLPFMSETVDVPAENAEAYDFLELSLFNSRRFCAEGKVSFA